WYQPAGKDTTLTVEIYNHGNSLLSLNSLAFSENTNYRCESFGSTKKLSEIKFRSIKLKALTKADPIMDIQAHQVDSLLIRFTTNTGVTKKYTDLMSIYSNAQEDAKLNLKGYGLFGTVIYKGTLNNMTWTPAGNPYHIIGDIDIAGTLNIQPGVNVLVQDYEKINVTTSGTLLANGTAAAPIHFSSGEKELFSDNSTKDGGWGGIRFLYSGNNDILDHCIIENGKKSVNGYYFSGNENSTGGAVYVLNSSPNITNSTFMNNNAGNGGAISLIGSSTYALINNCLFENNSAVNGGGVYDQQSNSQVLLSSFLNNQAGGKGGAIYSNKPSDQISDGETFKIIGNTIKNNRSSYGGGISVLSASPYLESNVIVQNHSEFGAGLYLDFCNSKLVNNTIADNSAYSVGAGVYIKDSSVPKFTNCIIFGNTAPKYVFGDIKPTDPLYRPSFILPVDENKQIISHSYQSMFNYYESNPEFEYCNIEGEDRHIINFTEIITLGAPITYPRSVFDRLYYKNVECNPEFDTSDYSLKATSPCIDLGKQDMQAFSLSGFDALNNPRIKTETNIDLGACEFQAENTPKPVLTHTVDEIDFGKVFAEQTKSSKLYLCNSGNDVLNISEQVFEDLTGNFKLSKYDGTDVFSMDIQIHDRDSLMVTFNPTDSINMYYLDAIITKSSGLADKRLPLSGTGVVQPDLIVTEVEIPPSLNSGESFKVSWKVKNIGVTGTDVSQWKDRIYLTQASDTETFLTEIDAAKILGEFDNMSYLLPSEIYGSSASVVLPEGIIGDYHIAVMTDCGLKVGERNEDNNSLVSDDSMSVSLTLPPDLQITSFQVPTDAESGSLIDLSWIVSNVGDNPTSINSEWKDQIYFSIDSVFNSNKATLLYTYERTGQLKNGAHGTNADSSYSVLVNVRLPHRAQGIHTAVHADSVLTELGECYLYVITDSKNTVSEYIYEGNNSSQRAIRLLLTPPDYSVDSVMTSDTTVYSGQKYTIAWLVKNLGPGVNNPFYEKNWADRLYISPDNFLNKDDSMVKDVVLATHYLDNDNLTYYHEGGSKVTLDSTYIDSVEVTIPDGYDGNYYIFAEADCNDNIFEYDEVFQSIYNNVGVPKMINVALTPPPDLYVSSITIPAKVTAGYQMNVSWEVINTDSSLTDKQWDDFIYISSSATFDKTKAKYLGKAQADYSGSVFGSNSSYEKTVNVLIPNDLSDRKYIHIITDAENTVYEHNNENNNVRTSEIFIEAYPEIDLLAQSLTAPDTGISGNAVNLSWIVKNEGLAPTISSSWYDAIYLSTDNICDPSNDIQLGKFIHYGKLDTMATYLNSKTVYLPNGIEGNFYLMIKTDITELNSDTDRLNNVLSKLILVSKKPYPDTVIDELIVTSLPGISKEKIIVPTDVTAGQPVKISWKISNGGDAPTQTQYWYDAVYLSKDTLVTSDDQLLRVTMRDQALSVGESYSVEIEEYIPNYASGLYYVILKTDVWDTMYEEIENNNIEYAPINITLPKIVDLMVTNIIFPDSADAGDNVKVEYTVINTGINTAVGWLTDGIYLSVDQELDADDPLMGLNKYYLVLEPEESVKMTSNLNIIRSFEKDENGVNVKDIPISGLIDSKGDYNSFTGQLPGVLPGDYYALVKVDMRNNIREDDLTNNTGYSESTISTDFPQILPGKTVTDSVAYSNSKFYKLNIDSELTGKDFRFSLKALTKDDAPVEIYIAHDRIPELYDFDYSSSEPFESNQEILLPTAKEGKYYIRLYCPAIPETGYKFHSYNLTVNEMIFSVQDILPNYGGTGGDITCRLRGASFKDSIEVYLYNQDELLTKAISVDIINSTELKVKWRLTNAAGEDLSLGIYDIKVVKITENSTDQTIFVDLFEIQEQRIELIANRLAYPENLRRVEGMWGVLPANTAFHNYVFKNSGNVDIPYMRADIKISDNLRIISV
ncbi:MAG: hypothetical protein KKD38_04175, partial [Candidatus Delongbacteria bacterium]|nr:hypothetical protein [Candidatus Delongbacteria bacterium]